MRSNGYLFIYYIGEMSGEKWLVIAGGENLIKCERGEHIALACIRMMLRYVAPWSILFSPMI
jgi:hypothetical protein